MPNIIFVSGTTFYFVENHPDDGDYVAASYAASHMAAFGHVKGQPLAKDGHSYQKHFAVPNVYQLAG